MNASTGLVGREDERQALTEAFDRARAGEPAAVLVCGEPGIGKTRLVEAVTDSEAQHGVRVLWARCLRFAAVETPFLAISDLITHWYRSADQAEREGVLAGLDVERLATIVPTIGGPAREGSVNALPALVSALVDRLSAEVPLALVVDDLQWADTSSLDLLAYLMAGFTRGQRLTILGTYRDTQLIEGHRLHGWLSDVHRLPGITQLRLERLGLTDTERLVANASAAAGVDVAGRVDVIVEKSRGNPYLAEVLARAPDDDLTAPNGLNDTLLASWHRMGDPSRKLTQLLAVGGRPLDLDILEHLARADGLTSREVDVSLREAVDAGLVRKGAQGRPWFHHPLLPKVIVTTIPAVGVAALHGRYARIWERATDQAPSARAAQLALHHDGANHPNQAYAWSLRAADLAAETFAWAEESQHLQRACRLWPRVRPAPGDQFDYATLLRRASESARRAGRNRSALDLGEQALAAFDETTHPLEVAGLLARVSDLRVQLDSSRHVLDAARHMLALTDELPPSEERVIALALLTSHELFSGGPDAASYAAQALEVARQVGSDSAVALGLAVISETHLGRGQCVQHSGRAVELARSSGQDTLIAHCAIARYNCLVSLGHRAAAADAMLALLREFVVRGAFYESVPLISCAAGLLVELGRWAEAREVLREGLGRRIDSEWGAEIRRAAADLAARTGDLEAATHHLARAMEISPATPVVGFTAASTDVRVAWAAGHHSRALARSEGAMPALARLDDPEADDLLVWSARAAADLAEEPGMRPDAVAWLERIAALRGGAPAPFRSRAADDLISPAWGRVYAAEHSRCAGEGLEQERAWEAAVAACRDAGLPWEQALSSYHVGRCLLVRSGDHRKAAAALREAARIGRQLGAEPLLRDVSELALQSHIRLDVPLVPVHDEDRAGPLGDATPREREILAHLVAGRTYAEIAGALFISEKTVSVHVSNLLRKTGTSNRVQLTQLAHALLTKDALGPQ